MPLVKLALHKYPAIVEAMENRHTVYNEQTRTVFEKADRGELFVICPEQPLGISRTEGDPEKLQSVYDEGRRVGLKQLEKVKAFLAL